MRVAALLLIAVAGVTAAATAEPGAASSRLRVGIFDESQTLYGDPERAFPVLRRLRTQVLRVNLYWGGRFGVARRRPEHPKRPYDPAYDWGIYDRVVEYANEHRIRVLFSIYGTPSWANGGRGLNRPPRRFSDLRRFAYAAARRYSGTYRAKRWGFLPPVRLWLAWNEPNNPIFLSPQYRRDGREWVVASAEAYARICRAVYRGVHAHRLRGQQVACGGTGPRGNNHPGSSRPSVSPLAFLRASHRAGLREFDAYAHHPYAFTEPPSARPQARTTVTLGNIDALADELTRLYGPKRIWLTEYGYQTDPPDRRLGVSPALQARYLREAHALARRHPRIDMLVWFLLRDETRLAGWQSGLVTARGRTKPAFAAFRRLPR